MNLNDRDALLSRLSGVDWPTAPLLDALKLDPGLDVLDVGAGDGKLLTALEARGHRGRRVGLDPTPGPGVRKGTAEALPFPAAMFDVVLFVRVLAHLTNPRAALAEARRVLRPDGRLIMAAHGPDHLRGLWRELGQEPLPDRQDQPGEACGLDLRVPLLLDRENAQTLAHSYGLDLGEGEDGFPVQDTLHLRAKLR